MDRDKNNDFPTDRAVGGGRRGYGRTWGVTAEHDSERRQINFDDFYGHPGGSRNSAPRVNEENLFSWISTRSNGVEGLLQNGRNVSFDAPSTSSEPEYRRTPEVSGHNSINYVQYEVRRGTFKCDAFASFAGFGFPLAQTTIPHNVTVPAHGQGGVGRVGVHGNQSGPYVGVQNDGEAASAQGNNQNISAPPPGGIIGTMFTVGRVVFTNSPQNSNEKLIKYITDSLNAFQSRNGDYLSDLLSVRDQHVFQMVLALPPTEYANIISLICNDRDLVEALITHIDCVKALASRNIPLAFYRQTACVNAVMRLLHEPYCMGEAWTHSVIATVTYELNVISSRMPTFPYRTGIIIRYSVVVTNTIYMIHPPGCQCNVPKLPAIGNVNRRA